MSKKSLQLQSATKSETEKRSSQKRSDSADKITKTTLLHSLTHTCSKNTPIYTGTRRNPTETHPVHTRVACSSETRIENKFQKAVKARRWLTYKFSSPSNRGVPDRIVIDDRGGVWFVELKRPKGGRLSKLQSYTIKEMKAHRANVRVIKNEKEIEDFLREAEK